MDDIPEHDNLEDILLRLRDEETTVRERAILGLQWYANSAGEPRNDTLTNEEAHEEWQRARTQCLQQRPIVEALVIAIDDPSPIVRARAASMLARVNEPEAQSLFLQHLCEDPVDDVRGVCFKALDGSPDSPQQVEALIVALQDADEEFASVACVYLGKLGARQAIEPLRAVLLHPSWKVRFRACQALVRLRAVDKGVVRLLEELNRQPGAKEHNKRAHMRNEFADALGLPATQTTQEVLKKARRALR